MRTIEINDRLADVLQRRRSRVPAIQARLGQLDEISTALTRVIEASLAEHSMRDSAEVAAAVARIRDPEVARGLSDARSALGALAARFDRDTINIGVSGRARVGKSTMLQSVAGLSDAEVPTGETRNVTAVRSRIFNASQPRAILTWHTPESFLDLEVHPYFQDLAITPMPHSIEAFLGIPLDSVRERRRAETGRLSEVETALFGRLMTTQTALDRIGSRLGAPQLVLEDLSDLRRYVAYPTQEEELDAERDGGVCARDYLAVRDCRIEAPFPVSAVTQLGLVDLPGLGETAAGFEDRILTGLRDEVDVVLLLKRAAVGLSAIDDIDLRTLDLLRTAQGPISDTRDFTWICVNAATGDTTRLDELRTDVRLKLNDGRADLRYLTVDADARDAAQVHERVLIPVLTRLSERLDVIDSELIGAAEVAARAGLDTTAARVAEVIRAIEGARVQSGSVREELFTLAGELLKDLQASLAAVDATTIMDRSQSEYLAAVQAIHGETGGWLEDGLGTSVTKADWLANARREHDVKGGTYRGHAVDELNRLRVEVTDRYAALDAFMNEHAVEELCQEILAAIGERDDANNRAGANRGALLSGTAREGSKPSDQLASLISDLEAMEQPVPNLVDALRRLSGMQFDFRLQSFPVLYELNRQFRPHDGKGTEDGQPYPPTGFDSPEQLYSWLFNEGRRYSYRIQQELLEDAGRQFDALRGAVLVLEDDVVRNPRAPFEMWNIAEAFRDDLWPGRFDDLARAGIERQRLARAARELKEAIRHFGH